MASTPFTFTLDADLAARARELGIDIPAAARTGVQDAVEKATAESDRAAYEQHPERLDPFWGDAEAWTEE